MRYFLLALLFMVPAFGQVVITDSGSTNRPGQTVTIAGDGKAVIESRGGAKANMEVPSDLHSRLMNDLQAAMPLDKLNVRHCAKSISFGSRTFITYNGVRSPDISCAGQTDPAVMALQKDVNGIMAEARAKAPAAPSPRFPINR